MTAYADFYYFALLLYPAIPALLLGLAERLSRRFVLLGTLAVLAVQYYPQAHPMGGRLLSDVWLLAGYALYQLALVQGFAWLKRRQGPGTWAIWTVGALSLLPLLGAKYLPLFTTHWAVGIAGISYLSFRALDALLAVQDKLVSRVRVQDYLAYLLFFPTISAGPIDRFTRWLKDWSHQRTRAEYLQDLDGALQRIFTGFLYKFILAYLIQTKLMARLESAHGLWPTIAYMYVYSAYLFFDFAGYTCFAVGVSYLFGVHTPANFDRPWLARNIREFWNRWHISLSVWLRDHVYMRFVMASARHKWFANRYVASYLGFLLTMGLMGLWHGSAWHFIAYGLYHGLLLAAFDWASRWNKQKKLWGDGWGWRVAGTLITAQAACFGFLIFSGRLF